MPVDKERDNLRSRNSYCSAWGCNNRNGVSKSSRRNFLRFYHYPRSADGKPSAMTHKWITRILRSDKFSLGSAMVCSDHFEDNDFLNYQKFDGHSPDQLKGKHISLKPDSIPNSDRATGERIKLSSGAGPSRHAPRVRLQPVTNFLSTIDDLNVPTSSLYDLQVQPSAFEPPPSPLPSIPPPSDGVTADAFTDNPGPELAPSQVKSCAVQTSVMACPSCSSRMISDQVANNSVTSEQLDILLGPEDISPDDNNLNDPDYDVADDLGVRRETLQTNKTYSNPARNISTSSPVKRVIIDMDVLLTLLQSVKCWCGTTKLARNVSYRGARAIFECICYHGHTSQFTTSQVHKKVSELNVRLVTAASLTGLGYTKLSSFCELMSIPFLSERAFYELEERWVYSEVAQKWMKHRDGVVQLISKKGSIVLAGDASFDSPGYSAKNCCYIAMETETNLVIDFVLYQRGQFDGNLEYHSCKTLLEVITQEHKIEIGYFVTDQHSQIATLIEDDYPQIRHSFDIWHFGKCLRKRILKICKKHEKVKYWENAIINHFWWSCQSCKGNKVLLPELFHSSLLHVLNIHHWGRRKVIHEQIRQLKQLDRKTPSPYPKPLVLEPRNQKCLHGGLTKRDDRATNWFKVDDADYKALFKVLTDTRMCNAMLKCAHFKHTGRNESLHRSKLKYLPKLASYTFDKTLIMNMLVCMEHNLAMQGERTERERPAFSRAMKDYTVKTVTTVDRTSFKHEMMEQIVKKLAAGKPRVLDLSSYKRIPIPKTFHGVPKPSLEELKKRNVCRFCAQ